MLKLYTILFCCFTSILLLSCSPSPKVIEYGEDNCEFCRMSIVDPQFAAEVVSSKGRAYKFDAIECMIRYMDQENGEFSLLLVNNFDKPKLLADSRVSYYLISENVPSPMGAYLSAYSNLIAAEQMQKLKGGVIYSWDELINHFTNIRN
ncbi:MAG: hypothetical protein HKN92_06700 [Chitinophagales bacterium]|nr:hypothetical protein [Chitinophagales bacterium]